MSMTEAAAVENKPRKSPAAHLRKWQPGECPNPGGRPKTNPDLRDAARALTPQAIATLASVMNNKKAAPGSRILAANSILDRAWGKPHETLEVVKGTSQLSDGELEAIIVQAIAAGICMVGGQAGGLKPAPMIEHEPKE